MNRLNFHFILFLFVVKLTNMELLAQQAFEGKIVYEISYPTTIESDPITHENKPKNKMETVLFFKGNKMRIETKTEQGLMVTIFDEATETCVSLTNINNQKKAIYRSSEEMEEEYEEHLPSNEKMRVLQQAETKQVAGYKCKQQILTFSKNAEEKIVVSYTEEIQSKIVSKNPFWIQKRVKKVKGFVLKYEIRNSNEQAIYCAEAIQITPSILDSTLFTIPTDYKAVKRNEKAKK